MLRLGRSRWSGMLRPQGVCRRWMSSDSELETPMKWPDHSKEKPPFFRLDEVAVLEERLKYKFKTFNLTHGLLHPSFRTPNEYAWSYKSLAPRGMFNLKSWCTPPERDGNLDAICNLNLSPHKLARNALRLGLYNFLRRNSPKLDRAVEDFTKLQEGKVLYTGIPVKVPDVLPELVFAFLGLISYECDLDYDRDRARTEAWKSSQMLVFPLFKWGNLVVAVEQLRRICSVFNMTLYFKSKRVGYLFTTEVFINKILHGSGISELEYSAQRLAAMDALNKLPSYMLSGTILENPFPTTLPYVR